MSEIRIAHLILAHKNPAQLERLINAMQHPQFDFFIHLDGKTDASLFTHLYARKNVFPVNRRTSVNWAGYGTIQATLNGFEEILPLKYDYINVISAQDFPLKSPDFIYRYINERQGTEFITCESIDDEWKEAAIRVRNYHLVDWKIPGKYGLARLLTKVLPKRKFPLGYKVVGRANWFTLTIDAAKYILDFLKGNPGYVRYFKYCWGGDEFFFATILYNSSFRKNIVRNLVYVDWNVAQKNGHPKILGTADFDALKNSDKLFARKFDMLHDPKIMEKLEELIGVNSNVVQR